MSRFTMISFGLVLAFTCVVCHGQDAALKELERTRANYEKEKEAFKSAALEAYDRKEELARKAGDKKVIDQIKAERNAVENCHAIATNVPPAVLKRKMLAQSKVETAFNAAIKASVRAKNDELATSLTRELQEFRGNDWPHLDLDSITIVGDAFQLGKAGKVSTKEEFSGPLEIVVVAKTEKDNIRLHAPNGASVIFNWEYNLGELRVTRPDGQEKIQSGTLLTANFTPLKPGVWYKLRWRMDHDEVQIYVNDQLVFTDKRAVSLSLKSRPAIQASGSVLEVRDFHVIPLKKE